MNLITTKENYDARLKMELVPNSKFYASLMTAYFQADTDNQERLTAAWPQACLEFRARYFAPNGCLSVEEWLDSHTAKERRVVEKDEAFLAHIKQIINLAWEKADRK